MTTAFKVAVLVGSLREASLNRKLAKALVALAPDGLEFEFLPIGELQFYNQDLEDKGAPACWKAFREAISDVDAVLFVTPEYNRSVPAALKNALDVGSRPMGESVWNGKPAGVVTGSPGAIGGFGANHALRQSLVFLNMPAMQQPEAYVGGIGDMFAGDGSVKDEDTKKFLAGFMESFAQWISRHAG